VRQEPGLSQAGAPGRGPSQDRPAPPLQIEGLRFSYNGDRVLDGIDLSIRPGEFVALMGRNGAGKTTLLKHCVGLLKPDAGRVLVLDQDTRRVPVEQIARRVAYVPQNPNALLFADTLAQELAFTRRAQDMPPGDDAALLQTLGLAGMRDRYPRDLSAGERQRAALAAVLVSAPELILLDEPTRGLDYAQKEALFAFLQDQQRAGVTVLVVTHDVELVAQCAERVILLGEGEIVLDGPVRQIMTGSQLFASQISKLFRDPRYLTVADVLDGEEERA
jgi:energy-coupling factor transport system ATP-binding protein